MSGGHFNYNQYKINEIAEEVKNLIDTNDSTAKDDWGYDISAHYPPEIIERFKEAHITLTKAAAMAQRIDWLVSGDDGEDSFLKRWDEELVKI